MTTIHYTPCELILKIGSNECDEISTAISGLLRTCAISEQSFFVVERQIQPTTYYGSFTSQSSSSSSPSISLPIQSQSLSCVLLLTDDILKQQQLVRPLPISTTNKTPSNLLPKSKHFFKSPHIWNFHHKIELLDENKHALARQDYYELSYFLPLWSVSHIPNSRQPIVRFNIFTQHFESMLTFYTRLFQRKPDSSKPGFVLFILPSSPHVKIIYQFSIKYSPSIQPYTIAQSAYFKFRLNNLDHFINEYSSKLFALNKFEYYIYDPDGNLLHLHLYDLLNLKNIEESNHLKTLLHTNDSGVGDSSDPPTTQLFSSAVPQGYKPFYPINNGKQQQQQQQQPTAVNADIDVQSHSSQSSHDSGRWSSISSNELNPMNRVQRTVHMIPITIVNSKSTSGARSKNNENHNEEANHNYRLKQQLQERTVLPYVNQKQQKQINASLYDSEPRLVNVTSVNNRYYSSMSDVQSYNQIRPVAINKTKLINANYFPPIIDYDCDVSYEVDSPRMPTEKSSSGYLNAFLLKKRQQQQQQQQSNQTRHVQQLIAQFEKPNPLAISRRPLSAPLVDPIIKPTKGILQRRINGTTTPISNKAPRKRSKSVTFECHSDDNNTSSADDDRFKNLIDQTRSPRINIGITLDSRLRKTPVLDMLRSTTMESDLIEPRQLNRTTSLRQPYVPMARF
ncbi:unnamed protein product [Rotaria socialis]|uniref:FAM124 domain-containing protein n=1 Tax=Rotaria socialis TaxID=392032 RepID=A0A820CW29_9BILA|nr:unnamed protein product [Rotaria socialis]CAF3454619.1 unnamed protein product [Rotaria socialis]CAF3601318.1 unnamed protein product [Rotaria socialis]CAF4142610.1 unnamed protein product [Rotaria socialis]CAF4229319.1 unnamed protein product [Rotaria socialis]